MGVLTLHLSHKASLEAIHSNVCFVVARHLRRVHYSPLVLSALDSEDELTRGLDSDPLRSRSGSSPSLPARPEGDLNARQAVAGRVAQGVAKPAQPAQRKAASCKSASRLGGGRAGGRAVAGYARSMTPRRPGRGGILCLFLDGDLKDEAHRMRSARTGPTGGNGLRCRTTRAAAEVSRKPRAFLAFRPGRLGEAGRPACGEPHGEPLVGDTAPHSATQRPGPAGRGLQHACRTLRPGPWPWTNTCRSTCYVRRGPSVLTVLGRAGPGRHTAPRRSARRVGDATHATRIRAPSAGTGGASRRVAVRPSSILPVVALPEVPTTSRAATAGHVPPFPFFNFFFILKGAISLGLPRLLCRSCFRIEEPQSALIESGREARSAKPDSSHQTNGLSAEDSSFQISTATLFNRLNHLVSDAWRPL